MAELFSDSFADVPRRIVLEIDDTCDAVHGQQQRALLHAHYGERCFLPIHIYQAVTGKPVAVIPRLGRASNGTELTFVPHHIVRRSPSDLDPEATAQNSYLTF